YQAIVDAYAGRNGYENTREISELNYQRAVSDIVDTWSSLWLLAMAKSPSIATQVNQPFFRTGDMFELTLTALPGGLVDRKTDLYIAFVGNDGIPWFITPGREFTNEMIPFRKAWSVSQPFEEKMFSALLGGCDLHQDFTVYALLVSADSAPSTPETWVSNLAEARFAIEPMQDGLLDDIQDESYLFPAVLKATGRVNGLPLQRWDFVFLGEKTDDPATAEDETLLNRLIPGDFRHALLYLGRDSLGRPCGLELTGGQAPFLRVVRFPEIESVYPSGAEVQCAATIKNIKAYTNRWAKRLKSSYLRKLRASEGRVFAHIARGLKTDIPYQMEYNWSGDFSDMEIELVDDGMANGASCTDYLLSLLEENAGICIHGSRMSAAEAEEYFRFDPLGTQAFIPGEWNPFPFPVTVADILAMGYHPVDPPPHIFPCDMSEETGVPIPSYLVKSPQLSSIPTAPLPPVYDDTSWGQEKANGKG
ncbi:MAG: hypothetical protein P8Y00_07535, partial [Deltaproteobacteria bacterium]